MYQPGHGRFRVAEPARQLAELAAGVPATLVTHGPGGFSASILPMLFLPGDGPHGTLRGHVARGNPQWRAIEAAAGGAVPAAVAALAIFDGADAYVSPGLYPEKALTGQVVPTWNYVTVQAHGSIRVHHDAEWLRANVRGLVERHEASLRVPWSLDDAPAAYIDAQLRAIVGLELLIDRIEAKRKLSQNRSAADVDGVIAAFLHGTPREQAVAEAMRREPGRHER